MLFKKIICFATAMMMLSTTVSASHNLPADPETGWITMSKSSVGETKVLTSTAPNNNGYGNYGTVVTSYIYVNDDNTFCVVDFSNNTINVDTYNSDTYELIKSKKIAMELPLFG